MTRLHFLSAGATLQRASYRKIGIIASALLLIAGCASSGSSQQAGRTYARRSISSDRAPAAIGPYSQAIQVGDMLYLSGQIGIDPATGDLVQSGIQAETRQVLDNLQAISDAAGFSLSDAVQIQVFMTDLAEFAAMNEEYASYFGTQPPARATVQVAALPRGARVEIMAIISR